MLSELYIRDFAIVDEIALNFSAGFSVLTGETGAGKSILIDALALALGERADSGVVRQGQPRAEVVARFELDGEHSAAEWLRTQALFADGECMLRRVVERDKGSKGFINGRPVPVQMLRELGELLVDVHGQHEHQSLLKRDAQRDLLDAYAQLASERQALAERSAQVKALDTRLNDLTLRSSDREARLELLRYQVQELAELDLGENEFAKLEEEHARLAHGAALIEGAQEIVHRLYDADDGSVSQALSQSVAKLEDLTGFDPKLAEFARMLKEAGIQVDEAAQQLRHYADGLDLDPERLQSVNARLTAAHELSRKHRVAPAELPAVHAQLARELSEIEDFDFNQDKLRQELAQAQAEYRALAKTVTQKRQQAATRLAKAVSQQMKQLGMPGGRFEAQLAPATAAFGPYGDEQIEFCVSANPDQPTKPLSKVASGGELSRISLALQVVTAELGTVPTLIFDEVDVGVGGAVAEIVGQQLQRLGVQRQVLCVTHLGQVAARGDQHYLVTKRMERSTTVTDIAQLDKKARVQEIARMIGGVEINQQTLALAKDMLTRVTA